MKKHEFIIDLQSFVVVAENEEHAYKLAQEQIKEGDIEVDRIFNEGGYDETEIEFDIVDVVIQYYDENKTQECVCAIGEFSEDSVLCQAWDMDIFYWFESKKELDDWKNLDKKEGCFNHKDFKVISYSNIRKAI